MPPAHKPFARLKVALVADDLTRCCLRYECNVWNVTPLNYSMALRFWKPDLLLVESAWNGWRNSWKYQIASYADHPERTNARLARLVEAAREAGVPCVFWNKEDGVHFDRFIRSAALFDVVLTVDSNCISKYKKYVPKGAVVQDLMFAVQPQIHAPQAGRPDRKGRRGCFVGSYSRHIHDRRRQWQDMILEAAGRMTGVTAFDRNSSRKSSNYRYPNLPGLEIRPAVSHPHTARIYREHLFSLNVNTVVDSPTMCSRRLLEIMACGGLAVTSPALAVEEHFSGLCHVVSSKDEAVELFFRLAKGWSEADREMARAAVETIRAKHTWKHRLRTICETAGIEVPSASGRKL